jgi:hypothetical protein
LDKEDKDDLIEHLNELFSRESDSSDESERTEIDNHAIDMISKGEWWLGSFSYSGIFTPMHVIDGD